jgi:hypothetical protein
MDLTFAALSPWIIALIAAIAMFAFWFVGIWLGRRLHSDSEGKPSKFDDASMALLGLLLAFAFGVSLNKYEQRRISVVEDTNAIGDFYTCATLLKEPVRTRLQDVIREYAELRLRLAQKATSYGELEERLPEMRLAHQQMTELVSQALRDGTPIAVSLTNTLNGVTSKHSSRLAAVMDRLPAPVAILLVAAAIVSTMLIGREQGATAEPEIAGTVSYILLVTVVLYVIFNLNRPESGLIRISQQPMEQLISSMSK